MNLKQLEAFVEVAEKNSFSKAAKSLYLTQPTVSAHISALEKELGSRLLIRNTKEVELSESGKRLYEYAKQIVLLTAQIEQEFGKKEKRGGKATVTIAASTVPAQYLLPNILMRFRSLYPMEQFRIFESDSAGVVEKVAARRADMGLTGTDASGKYCEFLPFYEDELIVITPNTVKFQNRKQGGQCVRMDCRSEPMLLRGRRIWYEKRSDADFTESGNRGSKIAGDRQYRKSRDDQTVCGKRNGNFDFVGAFCAGFGEQRTSVGISVGSRGKYSRNLCCL